MFRWASPWMRPATSSSRTPATHGLGRLCSLTRRRQHSKSFSLIDCISAGVDRMQRNFELMRKQVENWQKSDVTDVTAKVVIYEAFVEGKLEAPKDLARAVHGLHFEPKYEDFRPDDLEPIECIHFGVQGTG